jgi:mono/diheme cytochrome c family protein
MIPPGRGTFRWEKIFMHFIHRFLVIALLASAAAVSAAAVDKASDGKSLYRNNCKACHDKGSKNGVYTPMTLTQDQWRKFYSSKLVPAHKSAVDQKSGKKVLELLTPEQIKSIQRFCIDHAADSEQPATCG